ncbi:hypothetical protein [Rhodococcus sp. NPDC003348]
MTNDTDRTLTVTGEADLIEQRLDVVDQNEPDLDEMAQAGVGWDASEADRIDQALAVPWDAEERRT